MTKHHKFSQLTENFSQERKAKIAEKTEQLKSELALFELLEKIKLKYPEFKEENLIKENITQLRQLIQGVGGELDITIRISGQEIKINNWDDLVVL